jgi:hypothetical protein
MATYQSAEPSKTTPDREPTYALTLKGDGISIDRKIPADIAVQIVSLAMGGGASGVSSSGPQGPTTQQRTPGPTVAIREFLNEVSAKRNPDKITAMAVYLRDHQGRDSFSRDDVKSLFRKAGESVPANYSRDFGLALSSGWIAEDHATSGEYYVTKSGDDALAEEFQAKPTRSKRRRSKGSPKGSQNE